MGPNVNLFLLFRGGGGLGGPLIIKLGPSCFPSHLYQYTNKKYVFINGQEINRI